MTLDENEGCLQEVLGCLRVCGDLKSLYESLYVTLLVRVTLL